MEQAVDIEDITADWLSRALGYTVRGVAATRVGSGQTGASFRLALDADEGPPTLLAKVGAGDLDARERVSPGYRNEVGFYQHLAGSLDVRTPRCWYVGIADDATCFTLLLEDLAPRVPGVQADGVSVARARGALRNLAGLHAPRWDDRTVLDLDFINSTLDEEAAAFMGEVANTACQQFVERYRQELGSEDSATMLAGGELIARWAVQAPGPLAVVHGDYRPDNLMFGAAPDDVVALDWQTVSVAPPARDLAYFLGTSLPIETRREEEADLVACYHGDLLARGVTGYAFEQCFDDYRLGLLQATFITAIGAIFATAERSQAADEMFMAMASRSCAAIRDLGTLDLV